MRALFAVLLFSLAAHAFPLPETWIEPVAPTSRSFVTLHLRDVLPNGCVPYNVLLTKSGNVVEARWTLKGVTGCTSAPAAWADDIAIGLLDAGTYEVLFRIDERPPFERHTLIVTEAVPPFRLLPDVASVHGGETIRIVSKGGSCYPAAELLIGGAPVAVTQSAYCEYVFTAPPHAAGAVDATITRPGLTTKVTSAAALRYVDPSAPPDESAFERVLVPVLYNGPGAYGSQWVSEGRISVQEGPPLRWMHDVLNAECTSGACSSGRSVDFASFGNHPAGLLLFVPRGIGEIDASLLVRDTSREGSSWGAQVPVVREKDFKSAGNLQFPGVPFDPPYRGLLRIYGIDGATAGVAVGAGDSWRSPSLAGACADSVKPCNTARPAFAAVDLQQTFPELVGRGRFDVTVAPIWRVRPFRYWGFVTVTNNETQHVTVMTP